jgi:8-amino-7-oxononanoate synthase
MLETRLASRLREIESAGLTRTLRPPSGIDLSSNDYLALAAHPLLKRRMSAAVLREGCGSSGSRLLRGERESFSSIERRFAAFKGAERSLYFSSGYLANLAVLTTFAEESDIVFSDERNHASIVDGIRLSRARRVIFRHNSVDALSRLLHEPCTGQKFVVVESLFSMDGDFAPLDAYSSLCRSTGATLIVDEAHTVGIHQGLPAAISINTAGKALGVGGAFVAGSALAVEYLIQRARPFIFSTAPPPSVASAIDAALDIVESEPQRRALLLHNARYLRQRLSLTGHSQIIPIMIGENGAAVAIAQELQSNGFDVRAIRPPSVPAGTARLRISVNSGLSEDTLDRFVEALQYCLPKCRAAFS